LLAASDFYGVVVIGYVLVRLATGYQLWQIMVVGYILHWLLLPGLVLLPLMIWKRRWKRGALSGASVATFLALYGELFLPSFSAPTSCAATDADCPSHLVVMTFNLAYGESDDDRMIAALRASGADIIGLQEFSLADATIIKDDLSDLYPYQIHQGDLRSGIGLISRYPITGHEFLQPPSHVFPFVEADVDVHDRAIRVIVAHPPPPGRSVDSGAIVSRTILDTPLLIDLMTQGGPALLLADLNVPDQTEEYKLLRQAGLIDSWREEGWGFGATFPAVPFWILPPFPLWRIDYIWHTPHFRAQRVWLGPTTGSDHLSVLAELVSAK
jgi:endonuclease/exonuclease/phosphatase (EEP) superfamily protein YafD